MPNINKDKLRLVRVYTDDSQCDLNKILDTLSNNQSIIGLTVFRGIAGFGPKHKLHQVNFLDLSSQLPLVIEFFHPIPGVEEIIIDIHQLIEQAHIVNWDINLSY